MNDFWQFPYPSQRMPVLARNVVATSQPLAAQAGLQMLLKGGNAVDAVLATAITLTVVEPTSNGIGSDAFALVWDGQTLHGLNGSGRSPRAWSIERFAGLDEMPAFGWDAVTVPGAVDTWVQLSQRFGKLPFDELFAPAIDYAQNGYVVSPLTADRWAVAAERYANFPDFGKTFLPAGRAPRAGELFCCPDQARTLQAIAESKGESFYHGDLAEQIVHCAKINDGAMTLEDLANHSCEWVQPISIDYRGVRLHQIPPNGQGLAALIALGLLGEFDIGRYPADSADSTHLQIEAMKIALAEAYRHMAEAHLGLGQTTQAEKWAIKSLELAQAQEMKLEEGTTRKVMGQIHRARCEWDAVERELRMGLSILESLDNQYEVGQALFQLAQLHRDLARDDQYHETLQRTIAIFERLGAQLDLEWAMDTRQG